VYWQSRRCCGVLAASVQRWLNSLMEQRSQKHVQTLQHNWESVKLHGVAIVKHLLCIKDVGMLGLLVSRCSLMFGGVILIEPTVGEAATVPKVSGPAPPQPPTLAKAQMSSSTVKPSITQQSKTQPSTSSTAKPSVTQQPRASTSSTPLAAARSSYSNLVTSQALEADAQARETIVLLQKLNQLPSGAKGLCFVCMVHGKQDMYTHGTKGCTYSRVDDDGKLKPTVTQFRSGNGAGKAPANVGICWNCWLPDLKDGYHNTDQYGQVVHTFQDNIASFGREVYYHQTLRNQLAEFLDDKSVLTPLVQTPSSAMCTKIKQ
jgi:hypothetical protein